MPRKGIKAASHNRDFPTGKSTQKKKYLPIKPKYMELYQKFNLMQPLHVVKPSCEESPTPKAAGPGGVEQVPAGEGEPSEGQFSPQGEGRFWHPPNREICNLCHSRTAPYPLYSNYEAPNYLLPWLSPAGTRSPATRKRPGHKTVPFAGATQPFGRAAPVPFPPQPRPPPPGAALRPPPLPPRRVSPRLPAQPPTPSTASASSQRPPAPSPAAAPALPAAETASRTPRYGPC